MTDNWIELALIYPVGTNLRRSFRSDITQVLLTAFKAENKHIASEMMTIMPASAAADGRPTDN